MGDPFPRTFRRTFSGAREGTVPRARELQSRIDYRGDLIARAAHWCPVVGLPTEALVYEALTRLGRNHGASQDFLMPREPVDLTLTKIVKTVADVIPRFDPFFD